MIDPPSQEEIHRSDIIYTVCGYLSALPSLLVLLTFFLFRESFKGKYFMNVVFAISLNDFLSGIVVAFGFPKDETLCSVQGAFINLFMRTSWFFTVILSYQLKYLVVNGRLNEDLGIVRSHLICWTASLVFEILPLCTGNGYGADDDWRGAEPCYIKFNGHTSARNWLILVTFAIPLTVSLVIMFANSVAMFVRYKSQLNVFKDSYPAIHAAIEQSYMYPIAMLLCWFPCIVLFIAYVVGRVSYTFQMAAFSSSVLYGFCMALIFFSRSKIAKREWAKVFSGFSGNTTSSFASSDGASRAADILANPMLKIEMPSSTNLTSTTITENDSEEHPQVVMFSSPINTNGQGGMAHSIHSDQSSSIQSNNSTLLFENNTYFSNRTREKSLSISEFDHKAFEDVEDI